MKLLKPDSTPKSLASYCTVRGNVFSGNYTTPVQLFIYMEGGGFEIHNFDGPDACERAVKEDERLKDLPRHVWMKCQR